jgi:SulP family sulfate permease
MNGIDSVGIRAFDEVLDFYNANNIEFNICKAIGPVRDTLKRTGLMGRLGTNHNFLQIQDAVDDFHKTL